MGPDPMFTRIPVRGYKTTAAIPCNTVAGLKALRAALPGQPNATRQEEIEARHAKFRERMTSKANHVPMVPFTPTPSYGDIAGASGCYAETIEKAEDFPGALQRALKVIQEEKRQVLLDVHVGMDDGEK